MLMSEGARTFLHQLVEVRREAETLLGARSWFLLSRYGKLMDGPLAGTYVSGIACGEQLELVHRLARGEVVSVHLMHRHRPGNHEASSLRWSRGRLFMVFRDREALA